MTEAKGGEPKKDDVKQGLMGCGVLIVLVAAGVWLFSGDGEPEISEQAGPTAKEHAAAFYHSTLAVIEPCDRAGASVAKAAETGDPVAVYRAASDMEAACLATGSAIRAVAVPTNVGREAYDQMKKAQETCDGAYASKWAAAGAMKSALDDLSSVSAMAELQEASETVAGGTMLCAGSLVGAVMATGVTQEQLESAGGAKS